MPATSAAAGNSGEIRMLVELFDFHSSPETGDNWEETARWIKYEEDVEGLDKHWGRPHVAFLSFHSLMQFRQYFAKCLVLFDPHAEKFSDIVNRLAIGMVAEYGMDSATADKVANTLQTQRHRKERRSSVVSKKSTHTRQPSQASKSDGRRGSAISTDDNIDQSRTDSGDELGDGKVPRPPYTGRKPMTGTGSVRSVRMADPAHQPAASIPEAFIEEGEDGEQSRRRTQSVDLVDSNPATDIARMKERMAATPTASISRARAKPFMKRLSTVIGIDALSGGAVKEENPQDTDIMPDLSESTHIYAGVIESMDDVRIAMIRLKEAMRFDEVFASGMLPVRFIFVIVGPQLYDVDYHELGRTVATLMSNETFSQTVRRATSRDEVMAAVDDFLDLSVIIPPGDIDRRALLTVDDVRKALKQRKRAKTAVEEQAKHEKAVAQLKPTPGAERPTVDIKQMELETDVIPIRGRQDHIKDALRRTGIPFKGVYEDIKYRLPYYCRDYKDSLNFQCVTSALFLFCANFASAVAFGEVIGDKTDGYMGVTEILLAHGVCGVIWGMIACQPLCIQAAVGPFLVLEASLYEICKSNDLDFLAVRWWTGLWTVVFTLITTMVEGSFIVRYLTRFTEEIFTGLIAFIFIWEAFKFLFNSFRHHPVGALADYCVSSVMNDTLNGTFITAKPFSPRFDAYSNTTSMPLLVERQNQPNTALMSLLLVLLTFILTYTLKNLRHSIYFGRTLRKILSDFGVPISVVFVITLYELIFKNTYVSHLKAPVEFALTDPSKRDWLVHPLGTDQQPLPMWAIWACTVPALLVGILVFAEVEIIEMLLAKPDRCLKRPHGFHWDLIVCSGLAFGCSVFGLPWMCPAAVQSLSHVSSLTVMKRTAPGAAPKIDYVIEQRVTCIVVGILHAAAAFIGMVLRMIPVPVLFGLFLYLGVMGLLGLQFVDRLILAFIPQKYFPDNSYCQRVTMWRMHLFTFLQIVCFGILLAVNMIPTTALAFPFVLTLIALFRMFVIPKIFHSYELDAIDSRGDEAAKSEESLEDETLDSEDGVDKKAIL